MPLGMYAPHFRPPSPFDTRFVARGAPSLYTLRAAASDTPARAPDTPCAHPTHCPPSPPRCDTPLRIARRPLPPPPATTSAASPRTSTPRALAPDTPRARYRPLRRHPRLTAHALHTPARSLCTPRAMATAHARATSDTPRPLPAHTPVSPPRSRRSLTNSLWSIRPLERGHARRARSLRGAVPGRL